MAEVVYARRALADLERLFEFLAETDPNAAAVAVETIQDAIGILERHPLIGRLVEYDRTDRIFTAPAEKLTEDYVTGRCG